MEKYYLMKKQTTATGKYNNIFKLVIVGLCLSIFAYYKFAHRSDIISTTQNGGGSESRDLSIESENYIPTVVDALIRSGHADCAVLDTTSHWFGVTYPDDKRHVVASILQQIESGNYPAVLA